ncbi:LppU/SCO3897 family protein [Lentzea chajnantorensis]
MSKYHFAVRKLVAVTALALVVSGCSLWTEQPGVGECARVVDLSRDKAELTKVDCAAQDATYRLVSIERGVTAPCPGGDYVEEASARNRKTKRKTRECYSLNVRQGDCLQQVGIFDTKLACGTGTRRVTKVVDGRSDRSLCGPDDDTRTYDRPPTTICITK